VQFAEVQYRPRRTEAWTADEEANWPKASSDRRAVKRIRSGPGEMGVRKSANITREGQELEQIELTPVSLSEV
jgi:hypothetical protein